jgi:iron complex outermembrane receptor protein
MVRAALFTCAGVCALVAAQPAAAQSARSQPREVSEIVVTAAPYVVSMESTTTSVDVLKREDLESAPSGGLGDVLSNVPGVRSSSFGPGASRPVIRGLAGPRVLVLNNGIGMIDASGLSPDHQVASDPQEAERIEVLRGPSALAYGGSAIGGIVNIIDQRIPDTYEAGVHGRAYGALTSVDDGKEGSAALRYGFADHWSVTVDGVSRRTDDYDVPVQRLSARLAAAEGLPAPLPEKDTVENSWSRLDAYGGGLSYVGDSAWGGLAIKRTQSTYGSPAEEDVYIGLKQTRLDTRGGFDVDWGPFSKVKFAAGYADYQHTEFEDGAVGTKFLSKGEEGRVEFVQRDLDGWQGAVGLQGLHRNFDAIGEEALIPKTIIDEAGIFTLQRLDKDSWGVEGGLRLDRRKLDSLKGERNFTNVSASLGLFMRPAEGWFVGGSFSRTSRAPTEEELFSLGEHPATAAYEVGDQNLKKEVSYAFDGTIHYGSGPWKMDLHGFYTRYSNYIDLIPSGLVDADSGFAIFEFLQTKATFYGTEAEVSYRLWQDGERSFRLEGTADYVHATTDFGPAVRIPPWSLNGRAVFDGGWWNGNLELRTIGDQKRVADFELPTDGYMMLNASLNFRPLKSNRDFRLFIDGRNLTNVEAREHASFLKDTSPLPGRSVRVGFGYQF